MDIAGLKAMTAVINDSREATLAYLAQSKSKEWSDDNWCIASKKEFLTHYNFDDIAGIEGTALAAEDEILCSDGAIKGSEIL